MATIDIPIPNNSATNTQATQKKTSLYHTCRYVLHALSTIDSLQPYLVLPDTMTEIPFMSRLWHFCRQGSSLCLLFNALGPRTPIPLVEQDLSPTPAHKPKHYVYHFIIACREQLLFDPDTIFSVTDVFEDDTNGFVRVVNVLKRVVEMMEERRIVALPVPNHCTDSPMTTPNDTRDKIVIELLETERKYVEDLETLQKYMHQARSKGVLPPNTIHQLFGNLNALVDCQRKFLLYAEAQADITPQEQRFGQLFIHREKDLAVYEPFCANFQTAQSLVCQEHLALEKLSHLLSSSFELQSFLIKPVQRICKYPLLMKELLKTTPPHWTFHDEIKLGLEAIQRVAASVNETQRRQENFMVVQTLKEQVVDWSASDIDDFGPLHLHDTFMVYRGDPGRELTVYLFEKCLFVCREDKGKDPATSAANGKDGNGKKAQKKNKKSDGGSLSMASNSTPTSANATDSANSSSSSKLCVRGKILISRVVQVIDTSQDGTCSLQIFWSERYLQPGQQFRLDSFTLKCRHQEQVQLWESSLNGLIKQMTIQASDSRTHPTSAPSQHSPLPSSHCLNRLDSSSTHGSSLADDNNRYRFNLELPLSRQQSNDTFGAPSAPLSRQNGSPLNGFLPSPALRTSPNNYSSHFESTEDYSHVNTVPATELITQHVLNEQQVEDQDDYFDDDYDTYSSSITTPGTPLSFNSLPQYQHTTERSLPQIMMINNSNDSDSIQYRLRSQSSPNIHPPIQHNCDNSIPTVPSYSQQQQYHHHHLSSPHRYQDLTRLDIRRSNGDPDPQRPLYSLDTHNNHNNDTSMPSDIHQSQQNLSLSLESAPSTTKVKVHHSGGIYVLMVPRTIDYQELVKRIEKKMKCDSSTIHNNTTLASYGLKYRDEENDLITIGSNDDLQMGLEHRGHKNTVNFYIV